ncbi:hypothetical protein T265_00208 [Opisthorchis viverrini]|uniref:Uncharacterized protein n=1 Tax=Opisthorchis viverrini TaxID=6198 RepID=A0A075A2S2_OPIVI|nr:hypothetical protein T265_00208 [Opisthorchis viverrini]KER34018.1 hypothetical protein T265_00208 [Opisthorchis viverrini]
MKEDSASEGNVGEDELYRSIGSEAEMDYTSNEEILVRDSREKSKLTYLKQLGRENRRGLGSEWDEALCCSSQGGRGYSDRGRGCSYRVGHGSERAIHLSKTAWKREQKRTWLIVGRGTELFFSGGRGYSDRGRGCSYRVGHGSDLGRHSGGQALK